MMVYTSIALCPCVMKARLLALGAKQSAINNLLVTD